MKQEVNNNLNIDPQKLQAVAQKRRTITMIAVLLAVVIFIGWVIFFRTGYLMKPAGERSEGMKQFKGSLAELGQALADFDSDWEEAQKKRQAALAAQKNQSNANLNLSEEQLVVLKQRVAEKLGETAGLDATNWLVYQNDQRGFSFKYPPDWLMEVNESADPTASFTDIHLSNIEYDQAQGCGGENGFAGLEIAFGLDRDSQQDFAGFVRSQVNTSPEAIGLYPSGEIKELIIDGHLAYQVQYSGWDGACLGPGYFIEEANDQYVYIYTGYLEPASEWSEDIIITTIINSLKFSNK